jgi:hypothetical protein
MAKKNGHILQAYVTICGVPGEPFQSCEMEIVLFMLRANLLPIRPEVHGCRPAKADGFLRAIKMCSTTYFMSCKRTFHSW